MRPFYSVASSKAPLRFSGVSVAPSAGPRSCGSRRPPARGPSAKLAGSPRPPQRAPSQMSPGCRPGSEPRDKERLAPERTGQAPGRNFRSLGRSAFANGRARRTAVAASPTRALGLASAARFLCATFAFFSHINCFHIIYTCRNNVTNDKNKERSFNLIKDKNDLCTIILKMTT